MTIKIIKKPFEKREKEVLNLSEAAAFLGISYPTMIKFLRTGQIPHRQIKRRVLILKSALVKWLECSES